MRRVRVSVLQVLGCDNRYTSLYIHVIRDIHLRLNRTLVCPFFYYTTFFQEIIARLVASLRPQTLALLGMLMNIDAYAID